jgi:hypothetical protein
MSFGIFFNTIFRGSDHLDVKPLGRVAWYS